MDIKPNVAAETLTIHAETLTKIASRILTELSTGKYDKEVKVTETLLREIGLGGYLETFLWINKMTAPGGAIVPDGHGGWVDERNSRYDPKTGEFL